MKGAKSKGKACTKFSVKKDVGKKPIKKGNAGTKLGVKKNVGKEPVEKRNAASAFILFMEDFSKKYKENASISAIAKAGVDEWKKLSTAKKAPYVAKAEKWELVYEFNIQAEESDSEMEAEGSDSEDSLSDSKDINKLARLAVNKDVGMTPAKKGTAASAFLLFLKDFSKEYREKHPKTKAASVAKAGRNTWKKLSEAGKAPYVAKVEKEKSEYEKKQVPPIYSSEDVEDSESKHECWWIAGSGSGAHSDTDCAL